MAGVKQPAKARRHGDMAGEQAQGQTSETAARARIGQKADRGIKTAPEHHIGDEVEIMPALAGAFGHPGDIAVDAIQHHPQSRQSRHPETGGRATEPCDQRQAQADRQ